MQRLREHFLTVPLPNRFSPRHRLFETAMALHAVAVANGVPLYRDPATRNSVFTAAFLAARAYCCESGCRHCPYAPDQPDES